jgi:hypothetical protein
MAYRILLRRDTSTNWSENNPVLASGEPGYETDTGKLKIGDGSTTWNDLSEVGITGATGSVDFTSISSDILPSADRTYDIGATGPGNRWRNGYFQTLYVDAGTVYVGDVPITSKEGSISVTSINIGPPGVTGSTIYLGDNGTIVVEAEDGQTSQIGATGPTGESGPQGATGPAGSQGATGPAGSQGATGPAGPTGIGSGISEVTYSELYSALSGSSLTPGSYYLITDFRTCYDQPDYNFFGGGITGPNTYKQAEIDPIIVLATSENTLDSVAYQPSYPKDQIKYDVTWNLTEIMGGTAYGRITERIDEYNNRTDYDHRTITFKRYKTRFLDGSVGGKIISMNNGSVGGTGTSFLSDFIVDEVIFIESDSPVFYKVTDIASNTQMTVGGTAYYNFNDAIGFVCQKTYLEQETTPGCLYYFNDTGTNAISDGGNDMYDGGNILNTNFYNQIPYTHTQMNGVEGQATLEDFTFDGTVQPGYFGPTGEETNYFGEGSEYFTNTYPGLFVMSAYGVSVDQFSITGDLGADGAGQVEANQFTYEGYTIYTKFVYNAGDPSVNHLIIVNTIDEAISHTYDENPNGDDDTISNIGNATQIHYLLFGLAQGVKPTNQQLQNVYESYLNLIDGSDINVTLSSLYSNYTDVTDNLPPNSTSFSCLEFKQSNVDSDNLDFRNILTFDTSVTARNTYIGNSCDSWQWDERAFMLPNNVFTNSYQNNVDIWDNYFGNRFTNNTFGDDVYENWVGDVFSTNLCYDRFDRNNIKGQFNDNIFYSLEFESNTIGENFSGNRMMQTNDAQDNYIGNDFSSNKFFSNSSFNSNHIENNFNSNRISSSFTDNSIGDDFSSNDIYSPFEDNTIENNCYDNYVYNGFLANIIGYQFNTNTIGVSNNIGANEFKRNVIGSWVKGNSFTGAAENNTIGNNFTSNQIGYGFNRNVIGIESVFNVIGEDFQDNVIGNYFSFNDPIGDNFYFNRIGSWFFNNNSIGNNFAYNQIGNNFQSNTIADDFGFGGGQSRGNQIGNYFESNTIGEYFYDNRVVDVFNNNVVGDYFQLNEVLIQNLGFEDFTTNLGNIITFTNNTPSGTDNTYSSIGPSGGSGIDATFTVVVSGGIVTSVTLVNAGKKYLANDVLVIDGATIGGVSGVDDLSITVSTISETPSVYGSYNCTLFRNSNGTERLSYYDDSDILTIKDINN